MSNRHLFLAVLATLAVTGCRVQTDLGAPCLMVKKDPTGTQTSVPITEGEVTSGRDFISFGAMECDDFVCVRDASSTRPSGATDSTPATGYCSRGCEQNEACPAANPEDDKIEALKLTCRALLLDTETINLLCREDEAQCRRIFGETRTPYFCARGSDVLAQ